MDRSQAARVGQETVRIVADGFYEVDGARVTLQESVARAVEGTVGYPPDAQLPDVPEERRVHETRYEVVNTTTLACGRELAARGERVAALNFASAKNPGGGFQGGARAQEESLARSSALFACIDGNEMYRFHKSRRDPMYTAYAIYSPDVPVFRSDDGALLAEPWPCSFITSPAPNAGVVLQRDPSRRAEVTEQLRVRIDKVLKIAARHDHDTLVLGAWGCGVFRNDPEEVAALFHEALVGPFAGVFRHVAFAVLAQGKRRYVIEAFEARFQNPA